MRLLNESKRKSHNVLGLLVGVRAI